MPTQIYPRLVDAPLGLCIMLAQSHAGFGSLLRANEQEAPLAACSCWTQTKINSRWCPCNKALWHNGRVPKSPTAGKETHPRAGTQRRRYPDFVRLIVWSAGSLPMACQMRRKPRRLAVAVPSCVSFWFLHLSSQSENQDPAPPNIPLSKSTRSLLDDGIWDVLKGSWGVVDYATGHDQSPFHKAPGALKMWGRESASAAVAFRKCYEYCLTAMPNQ